MSERRKMWLVFAIAAAIMVLCFFSVLSARACECCPEPVVKVEWRDEWVYEFTDGSIVVTGTERLLCWQVVTGTVSEIQTKAGQDIECWYPQGAESGCLEAEGHDFSNALFCKEPATAVGLSTFTARAATQEPVKDDCAGTAMLGLTATFIWGIVAYAVGRYHEWTKWMRDGFRR